MKKRSSLFTDGVIDVHFIDVNTHDENNMALYADYLYEAIDYAQKNHIYDVYLPGEYISLRKDDDNYYNNDIKDVISTLKSMIFEIEKF